MAVVKIDAFTYEGYFKVIPDNASPNTFYLWPKPKVIVESTGAAAGIVYSSADPGKSNAATYGSDCIDGDGNALATSAAVANFISQNR